MEGNIVGNPWVAHCTEIDGIKVFQYLQAILRHHPSMLKIIFTAPWKIFELKLEVSQRFQKGSLNI